jgi:triphosphatase
MRGRLPIAARNVGGSAPRTNALLLPMSEIGAPLDTPTMDILDPIVVTKVRRRIQRLELPGAVIEVAFDEGSIEAGERFGLTTEVELELKLAM